MFHITPSDSVSIIMHDGLVPAEHGLYFADSIENAFLMALMMVNEGEKQPGWFTILEVDLSDVSFEYFIEDEHSVGSNLGHYYRAMPTATIPPNLITTISQISIEESG